MPVFKFLKSVRLSQASRPLAEYVEKAHKEPLVITSRGKPVAVIVPVRHETDLECLSLGTDPDFLAFLEKARARAAHEQSLPLEEVRKRLGIPPRRKQKRAMAGASKG